MVWFEGVCVGICGGCVEVVERLDDWYVGEDVVWLVYYLCWWYLWYCVVVVWLGEGVDCVVVCVVEVVGVWGRFVLVG